ncbi:MAG: TRAP transporter large permease subunit [Rubrivivax sp.]|nr:MAG: TRAP transporter large permease subunit [Rubrivivax sp.]
MTTATMKRFWGRTPNEWLVGLPFVGLLMLILLIGTGEMMHGQLLRMGENLFGDKEKQVQYFMLRADPVRPACDRNLNVDAEVARQLSAAKPAGDAIDDLFADEVVDPAKLRDSVTGTLANCRLLHAMYERTVDHITPSVVAYRTVETSFLGLFGFGADNRPMILLVMIGVTVLATTLGYHHISLVPARTALDYRLQSWTMAVASGLLLFSSVRYYQISLDAGVAMEKPDIHIAWMVVFALLALASVWQLLRPLPAGIKAGGTFGHALQAAPLAAIMAIVAAVYFLTHNHPAGLAIYVHALMEFPNLPLQLALFIWGCMLLKQSRLVDLFMNVLRPWKLSPEALTYVVLLAAAVPTAYTGGSGAFVIAAGAIIYHEVRAVGGSSQFALAATAMSGSLGVVLRPSLLVVAIVAIDRHVTSDELFHWGLYVFVLTSTLFFIASQLRRTQRVNVAPPAVAFPAMLRQIPPLLPHIFVMVAVATFYSVVLDTPLNEISAPIIMPVIMLIIVAFDKLMPIKAGLPQPAYAMNREERVEPAIRAATVETVGHLGGYLFLIVLSQAIGGVIERSDIISLAPSQFSAPWVCMAFMAITLVVLGMFMEPLGAIFLVSGSLAPLAYANGIDPVHFWMMVLVAFELGYLMPPVALNQLLARQVVGDDVIDAADREVAGQSFYRRYERWILPCAVMTLALAIVSFGPLMWPS